MVRIAFICYSCIFTIVVIATAIGIAMASGILLTPQFIAINPVNDTVKADVVSITGTTTLSGETRDSTSLPLHDRKPAAGSGQYIKIDPVPNGIVGDRITIAGRTNHSVGTRFSVRICSLSRMQLPEKRKTDGETVKSADVIKGYGRTNLWSAEFDTASFDPGKFTAIAGIPDDETSDISCTRIDSNSSGQTTFTLFPEAAFNVTTRKPDPPVYSGIHIDPVGDIPRGDELTVTGTTKIPPGTFLVARILPVLEKNGIIRADYPYIENVAVTSIQKGNNTTNRFMFSLETGMLHVRDHILIVSQMTEGAVNVSDDVVSLPSGQSGSAVFRVKNPVVKPGKKPPVDLSDPWIYLNTIPNLTTMEPVIVTGTTNRPAGSRILAELVRDDFPDSKDKLRSLPPAVFSSRIPTMNGTSASSIFSVSIPTGNLVPGTYIMFVTIEGRWITSCTRFTLS